MSIPASVRHNREKMRAIKKEIEEIRAQLRFMPKKFESLRLETLTDELERREKIDDRYIDNGT